MPLTIAAIALFGVGVMGLPLAAAIVLGAALAPTDPVLAGDVGVGPPGEEDEREPHFAVTAEAGLNDGLAFPSSSLGLFLALEAAADWVVEWILADIVYAVPVGLALGGAAGTRSPPPSFGCATAACSARVRRLGRRRRRARALRRGGAGRRLRLPRGVRRRARLSPLRA